MLLDALLGLVLSLLEPVAGALPRIDTPITSAATQAGAGTFASWLDTINQLIPVKGPITFWAYVLTTTLPALIVYRIALFVYKRVRG